MKSAFVTAYGSPERVQVGEQPMPELLPGHVLVKMKAASVNPIDWKTVQGDLKALVRARFPLMLGSDGAGIVEQLGAGVSGLAVGDEVFFRAHKMDTGTFAQYFALPAKLVAQKPSTMSFAEAAAIPLVGLTSLQALKEKGGIKPGSRVLVHAGAGGVGTFAIQYAKVCGAYVATTASKQRNELLNELGADEIVDYHARKFEDVLHDYDIVLDTLGDAVHDASYKVLKKGGVLVTVLGIPDTETIAEYTSSKLVRFVAWLHNRKKRKQAEKYGAIYKHHLMYADAGQLEEIAGLIDAGKIRAVIDSTFSLDQIQAAFERSMTGRSQGKIVIIID